MAKKHKKKKVNHLSIKECEEVLARLKGQDNSLYYQHVLQHYRRLLPDMGSAVTLGQIHSQSATFKSSNINN